MRRLFDKYPVEAVLLLMLLCLSPFMAMRDLTPANELRYLSITDEALRDGHLFAFFNHGVPYADKPPLYFWLLMLCKKLFGRHCLYLLSLFSFLPAAVVTCVMDRWVFRGQSDATPRNRAAMALLLGSTSIYALGFLEGGNAWTSCKKFNPFDMKRSAGVGVRLFLPMIGMMGIDWAYGFDKVFGTRNYSGGQFHFIIGQEF